jgi:hypothetical protein
VGPGGDRTRGRPGRTDYDGCVAHGEVDDRRLEAILARIDKVASELERLNRRLDQREELTVIAHELRTLNESLQALAYAALGQQGPQVRRRRTG